MVASTHVFGAPHMINLWLSCGWRHSRSRTTCGCDDSVVVQLALSTTDRPVGALEGRGQLANSDLSVFGFSIARNQRECPHQLYLGTMEDGRVFLRPLRKVVGSHAHHYVHHSVFMCALAPVVVLKGKTMNWRWTPPATSMVAASCFSQP